MLNKSPVHFDILYLRQHPNFMSTYPSRGLLRDCEIFANEPSLRSLPDIAMHCQHSAATPQHQDNFDVFDDGGGDSGDRPAPGNIFVWLSCVEAFALNCHREC